MIDKLEEEHPGTKRVMLAALQNVRPSQLFDQRLWQLRGVTTASDDDEGVEPTASIPSDHLVRN
jgi:hypothetical protein